MACEDGYDFAIEPANLDVVNDELLLRCNSSGHTWESNRLPECSGIYFDHRSFDIFNDDRIDKI